MEKVKSMKSEFLLAFNEVLEHYGLPRDVVLQVLETALVNAYRRAVNGSNAQAVTANIDLVKGTIQILAEKEVVDEVQDGRTEVSLENARAVDPNAELGALVMMDSTPEDFGRIATQTAKQIVHQRLRDAERDKLYEEWSARKGEIVHGTIQALGAQAITVSLGRAEAVLPKREQLPTERYRQRDRIRAYLMDVSKTSRGPQILLSRADRNMLRRLLESEVPEIYQGMVEIKGISREPGMRSKVAVAAVQPNLDPVGACVGMRGGRIQAIVKELNGEKIDVIEWNPDPAAFIAKALSPARVSGVYLDEDPTRGKTALVVVPEDQLSLAIGREGVNARLAAKLTGWRIDIKSVPEATADAVQTVTSDPAFAEFAQKDPALIQRVQEALGKKAEGHPLPPEDYQAMDLLVRTVETSLSQIRDSRRKAQAKRLAEVRKNIPQSAYQVTLPETMVPEALARPLAQAGYASLGQLFEQLTLDPDPILALPEMGARNLEELKEVVQAAILAKRAEEAEALARETEAKAQAAAVVAPELTAEVQSVAEAPSPAEAVPGPGEEKVPELVAEGAPAGVGVEVEEEEEETEEGTAAKKKLKKKKKAVMVEYDPVLGVTVARKKHKPGRGREWEETETLEEP
jgi:N utilization substance protein A